jgi:hypothetical protein
MTMGCQNRRVCAGFGGVPRRELRLRRILDVPGQLPDAAQCRLSQAGYAALVKPRA